MSCLVERGDTGASNFYGKVMKMCLPQERCEIAPDVFTCTAVPFQDNALFEPTSAGLKATWSLPQNWAFAWLLLEVYSHLSCAY